VGYKTIGFLELFHGDVRPTCGGFVFLRESFKRHQIEAASFVRKAPVKTPPANLCKIYGAARGMDRISLSSKVD